MGLNTIFVVSPSFNFLYVYFISELTKCTKGSKKNVNVNWTKVGNILQFMAKYCYKSKNLQNNKFVETF